MHTIVDSTGGDPIALNYNSDWSGSVILIVGAGGRDTYLVEARALVCGRVEHVSDHIPFDILLRSVALAAKAYWIDAARRALDDLS